MSDMNRKEVDLGREEGGEWRLTGILGEGIYNNEVLYDRGRDLDRRI